MKTLKKCSYNKRTLKRVSNGLRSTKIDNFHNISYTAPIIEDTAIGLVYFNVTGSKRLLMNYLYCVEKLKLAKIPNYTIEMYVDKPDIADAVHIQTENIIFQKERLCYVLEKHIPKKYKKLIFMDTDVIYDNINWYNEVSEKLDDFDVVQCYSNIYYLDITYKIKTKSLLSYKMKDAFPKIGHTTPGGSWGFKRDWFNEIGFFQHDPIGGSDSYSLQAWTGGGYMPDKVIPRHLISVYNEFTSKIKQLPEICYIEGALYHLWHGTMKNRQYGIRGRIFNDVKDIRDIMKIGKDNIFVMTNKSFNEKIKLYFKRKNDDGI